MTDLEHDLTAAANNIPLGTGDLDKVMSLGRRRRSRRQQVMGGVTAVALVAGLIAVVNRDDPKPTPLATQPAVTRGNVDLQWESLSSTAGLGMSGSDVNGLGPFYALSTAPGQADVNKERPSRVLWRSDDGVSWTAATTLGNDLFLSDLAPADGRVYAVGTAPAQAGVKRRGDLVAGWSDDGGKHFSKNALPIDWAAIEAGATSVGLSNAQIASSDKGTVVTASLSAPLDVPKLLPNGATAPDGWATTATGVDVLGPDKGKVDCPAGTEDAMTAKADAARGAKLAVVTPNDPAKVPDTRPKSREIEPGYCFRSDGTGGSVTVSPQDMRGVVHSYSWSDLNVAGDLLNAATQQVFAFFAPSGSADFTRVDLSGVRADVAYLDSDDSGFHLFTTGAGNGNTAVTTADLSSPDGRTWTSAAGPGDLRWVSAAGTVGGHRIVVGDNGGGTVVARADGNGGWTVTPLTSIVDPAESKGRPVQSFAAGVGPLGVVIAATPESDDKNTEAPTLIVFSRDGSTWDDKPVQALAGHAVGVPIRIFVSGTRAVVALSGGSAGEGKAPKPQTILVGTSS